MGEESQEFTETKFEPKLFVEKHCTTGQRTIPHQKFLPECRDVTKQNCVTLWETDADGKQVWAGTDACEPVTWKECKLVPKDVQFIVSDIKCSDKQELWYHEPEPTTNTRVTNTFGCKVSLYNILKIGTKLTKCFKRQKVQQIVKPRQGQTARQYLGMSAGMIASVVTDCSCPCV